MAVTVTIWILLTQSLSQFDLEVLKGVVITFEHVNEESPVSTRGGLMGQWLL